MAQELKKRPNRLITNLTLGCLGLFGAQPALADGWEVQGQVSVEGQYDDNPRLRTEGEEGVFGISTSPELTIRKKTPTSSVYATGAANFAEFSGDGGGGDDLDSIDQRAGAGLTTKTRLSTLALDARYSRVPTRVSEVEDTGVLTTDATRTSFAGDAAHTYRVSRRDVLSVFGNAQDVSFSNTNQLTDYRSYGGGAAYRRLVSSSDELGLSVSYSRFDPSSNNDTASNTVNGHGSWSNTVSPQLSFAISAGGDFIWLDPPGSDNQRDFEFFLEAGVDWKASKSDALDLTLRRSAEPSGSGTVDERNTLKFGYRRDLTKSIGFDLAVNVLLQDSVDDAGRSNDHFFLSVQPKLSWQFLEDWTVSASYRYRRQELEVSGDPATSNAGFLTIQYQSPPIPFF
jgi:hypothetical protein